MVYKLSKVYTNNTWHEYDQEYSFYILKCKHMAHATSLLNNIFLLHTQTQNYHLKYPNVLH